MTILGEFPGNRYCALEEIQKVLGFSRIEWQTFFKIIRKANDGYLEFNRGGLNVQFALWSEDEKKVSLNIEFHKNKSEKSATYEYSLDELEAFSVRKRLKVSSFREK
jgi:hypothetical protein